MKSGYYFSYMIVVILLVAVWGGGPAAWARTEVGADGATVDTPADTPGKPAEVDADKVEGSDLKSEKEASQYMRKHGARDSDGDRQRAFGPGGSEDHFLGIQLGGFVSSDAYQWGVTDHATNPGRLIAGLTYRMGPLSNLADWALRADFIGYEFVDGRPLQLTVEPVLMFPEAGSYFPLYFGLGLGPGIFFSQIQNESFLAFDYTLLAGVRFFDLFGSTGLFLETGLKNHILLLSDGQFNGYYLSVGAMFTF